MSENKFVRPCLCELIRMCMIQLICRLVTDRVNMQDVFYCLK